MTSHQRAGRAASAATFVVLSIAGLAAAQPAAEVPIPAAQLQPATPIPAAPAAASPASGQPAADVSGERATRQVGKGEQLGFRQAKVAAEMSELEERMFRLADALKALEPENSSRLMLGLKFSREELILHQMQKLQEELAKLELTGAVTEQKQVLTKLERLQDLLMSGDLDFQMKLARLRQIRQIVRRLDGAIKEEDRELGLSKKTGELQKELDELRQRQQTLAGLIAQQRGHVAAGGKLIEAADRAARTSGAAELREQQQATQAATEALAQAETPAAANLQTAAGQMGAAAEALGQADPQAALPQQQAALEALEAEQARLAASEKELAAQVAAERFAAMRKDQSGNRRETDAIAELTRQLGGSGADAAQELIRASGSMSGAEGALGKAQADPASRDQNSALESLKYARNQLEAESERLLDELRAEVKKRVLEALTLMLERQQAVRQTTASLAPKAAAGSRQALNSVIALAKAEGQIAEVASETIALVEETGFGIALPAALSAVRDEMLAAQEKLAAADAGEGTIALEQQIEADLAALLEAMKQMPSSKGGGKNQQGKPGQRERELNRIIAELKMIRLLQVRLNGDTVETDRARPADAALPEALRRRVEALGERQGNVRDVTERLSTERGSEVNVGE